MNSDGQEFGILLRACRQTAGLSQEELAERSGLSLRSISNLERGRTRWPYRETLHRLADALELHDAARAVFIGAAGRRLAAITGVLSASPARDQSRPADTRSCRRCRFPRPEFCRGNCRAWRFRSWDAFASWRRLTVWSTKRTAEPAGPSLSRLSREQRGSGRQRWRSTGRIPPRADSPMASSTRTSEVTTSQGFRPARMRSCAGFSMRCRWITCACPPPSMSRRECTAACWRASECSCCWTTCSTPTRSGPCSLDRQVAW